MRCAKPLAIAVVLLLAVAGSMPVAAQDYPVERGSAGAQQGRRASETAARPAPDSAADPQRSSASNDNDRIPRDATEDAVAAARDAGNDSDRATAPARSGAAVSGAPALVESVAAPDAPPPRGAAAVEAVVAPHDAGKMLDTDAMQPAVDEPAVLVRENGAAAPTAATDDPAVATPSGPYLIDPSGNPPERAGPMAPLHLLGTEIAVGTRVVLDWHVGESFDGSAVSTPVVVLHGAKPGPRLCLTAAVHGDELNGIEVVRRIVNEVDPKSLGGTVIGVPVVNLLGFSRGSRYLPDRRDLNRFFPGSLGGSAASRIAYSLFNDIVLHCDALVDFHTGSFDRANLPQVRGDLRQPAVLAFTRGFGATPVLHSPGARGMLRLAASLRGIPAVTFEVGAPQRIEPEQIEFAVQAISTLMHKMGMTSSFRLWAEPQATYYESKWVRADHGGMLISTVRLGDRVREGQRLGKVVDPLRNSEHEILAPFRGRVIGVALNQVVLPGFAAYHIGIETSERGAVEEALSPAADVDAIERMEGDEMAVPPAVDDEARTEPDAPVPPN